MRTRSSNWLIIIVLTAMVVFAAPAAFAQTDEDPVGTGALFDIGMGARALGMGGAFVAVADDANALYYNPAGLALIEGHKATSLYSTLMGAGSYLGAGYAQKNIGAAVFGLMSTVDKTDEYGNPTGELDYREGTVAGGYARAFGPFALGGAVKLYAQEADVNRGFGATGDIGALISLPYLGGIKFGAVARNMLGTIKFESGHKDNFDPSYVLGLSLTPLKGLIVAADYDVTHSIGRVGAEYQIVDTFAARAGATVNADKQFGFTAGAGFAYESFRFDYAYQFHAELPDSHWLSVGFSF
ncbi:MAG: hypothetical protein KA063_03435 [Firmicutes bacterium]|nr:hypothetical protein [Bacillota bacterium]